METNYLEEFEEKQLSPTEKRVVAFIRIYLYLWAIMFILFLLSSFHILNPDDIVNYINKNTPCL